MRAVTTTAIVHADHTLTMRVPPDILPGVHEIVIVINSATSSQRAVPTEWRLPVRNVGPWPEGFTCRREDIYGDDGR
jgi:hypothetical protein